MDETLRLWGTNIRHRRNALGMTQEQLAKILDVGQATISRWEAGDSEPRRKHKAELARVLSTDVAMLFPLTRAA